MAEIENSGDRARMISLVLEIENSAQCAAEAKMANKNLTALGNKNAIISSNKVMVQLPWEQSWLWLLQPRK